MAKGARMKLLVDGVFFQLANSGIARVWRSLLPRLATYPDIEICLLDRGRAPEVPGVRRIDFPAYTMTDTAADSLLIEQIGEDWGADIFSSTYYTTPVSIPSVLIVHDMIPELFDFDMADRMWQEKALAISFARSFLCVSENTRDDLLKHYPDSADRSAIVARCGLDHDVFRPQRDVDVQEFKQEYGLKKPYFLLVGSREQHKGYKNARLLFDAIKEKRVNEFDILCVGGERELQRGFVAGLPKGVEVRKIEVDDRILARAYAGAQALVFPSLYEGFGLPVAEAMACGCPVITTALGSLKEVAGDAAELISGRDPGELAKALDAVREPRRRAELIARGYERAKAFDWDTMAKKFHDLLGATLAGSKAQTTQRFLAEWKRLREIQAAVDIH
ncbi:MAG: glycosyltransferase family 1 protein [Hyphomicrobium sp.]|uniref:glycosyltransferase family 4 protein n=1 Tax=Hyphomicrobium sp. TaxID=82 RepID=UPI0039E5DBE0